MITAIRTHGVGTPVEKHGRGVDDPDGAAAVHRAGAAVPTPLRLSSTALTGSDASVHWDCATFSPVSTAAKTMDETLSSSMGNDKNDHQVDSGDNPLVERSDA